MAETDSLTSSIFYVFILLVIGVGLMVFLNPNPAPQPDQPQITQTEPEISPETLTPVGSFKINDLEITQYLESTPSGHAEVFAFSNSGPKAFLLIAPKSLAPKASDLVLEGTSIKDVQVLESDPVLLVYLDEAPAGQTQTFKVFLTEKAAKAAGEALEKSKVRFVLTPVPPALDPSLLVLSPAEIAKRNNQLKQIADHLRNLPEHAFDPAEYGNVEKLLDDAGKETDPVLAMQQKVAAYGATSEAVTETQVQIAKQIQSLSGIQERRRINLATILQTDQIPFFASGTQGGAMLRLRLILSTPLHQWPGRPFFAFTLESDKLAKVVSVSVPTRVDEFAGYVYDVDVVVKMRESAIKGGVFPETVLYGTLEPNLFSASPLDNRKVRIALHLTQSKPFIHAGYFVPLSSENYRNAPYLVFVTNDAPTDLDVDVCGKTVKIASKTGYSVPVAPPKSLGNALVCAISQGGKKVFDLRMSDTRSVAPVDMNYFTPYDEDLSCAKTRIALANFIIAYGQNLKAIDPEAYRAINGKDFTQTAILRTGAVSGCELAAPFDVIGPDADAPQTLENARVYAMTLHGNMDFYPQVLSYLTLDDLKAGDSQTQSILAKSYWQDEMLKREVTAG